MIDFIDAIQAAGAMVVRFDADLAEIVALSLKVSLSALFAATLLGLPLGAVVAITRFPGRKILLVVLMP